MNNSIFAKLLKLDGSADRTTRDLSRELNTHSLTTQQNQPTQSLSQNSPQNIQNQREQNERAEKALQLEKQAKQAAQLIEDELKEFLKQHWSFIFPLEYNEIDEFVKLQNKCLPGEPYDADIVQYLIESSLVYKIDGVIVGGIIVGKTSNKMPAKTKYESKKGFIETIMSLFVDEHHRGKKIGKALLYAALHGFEGKCIMLHVRWTNKQAIELYKKVGFLTLNRIRKYYQNPIEDAWEMVFVRA